MNDLGLIPKEETTKLYRVIYKTVLLENPVSRASEDCLYYQNTTEQFMSSSALRWSF